MVFDTEKKLPLAEQQDGKQANAVVVDRLVGTVPTTSARASMQRIMRLVLDVLQERQAPRLAGVARSLEMIAPLVHFLIVTHRLETGWMELDCGDLRVRFFCRYGEADEDLSVPAALDWLPLLGETVPSLNLYLEEPLADLWLEELIWHVNERGDLVVRMECLGGQDTDEFEEKEDKGEQE